MTASPAARSTSSRTIPTGNLNSHAFAPFGQVIQNPATHEQTGGSGMSPRLESVEANQGTATKWLDISHLETWYSLAASKKPARAVLNLFVCRPRTLELHNGSPVFRVQFLERHPFTPQTFVPLGVSATDRDARYLVIVAPTLRATARDKHEERVKAYPAEKPRQNKRSLRERLLGARPNPFTNDFSPTTTPATAAALGPERKPKGPGEPDLKNLRAFVARGDQAVTYGPGTWHAPMVVLGEKAIDFVVVQYANGVGSEDCQEVDVASEIVVDVDAGGSEVSGAGIMRAKL